MTHETNSDQAAVARLTNETRGQKFDAEKPPKALLDYLSQLQLSDEDLQLLFGDSLGFTPPDVRGNALKLWYSLRDSTANLLCSKGKPREAAGQAITAGAPVVFDFLLSAFSVPPGTPASTVLAAVAVWLTAVGLGRLAMSRSQHA